MQALKVGLTALFLSAIIIAVVASSASYENAALSVPEATAAKKGGGSGKGGCDGKGTAAGCFSCNDRAFCNFVCVGYNECTVQYKPEHSCSASGFCASGGPFMPKSVGLSPL